MLMRNGKNGEKLRFFSLFARVGVYYKERNLRKKRKFFKFLLILLKLISELLLKREERMHHPKFFTVKIKICWSKIIIILKKNLQKKYFFLFGFFITEDLTKDIITQIAVFLIMNLTAIEIR